MIVISDNNWLVIFFLFLSQLGWCIMLVYQVWSASCRVMSLRWCLSIYLSIYLSMYLSTYLRCQQCQQWGPLPQSPAQSNDDENDDGDDENGGDDDDGDDGERKSDVCMGVLRGCVEKVC